MKKLTIHQKPVADDKLDSFWYDGAIARKGNLTLWACGDVRLSCDCHPNNDDELGECYDKEHFIFNNWFDIVDDDNNSLDEVCGTYDDAIKTLKEY